MASDFRDKFFTDSFDFKGSKLHNHCVTLNRAGFLNSTDDKSKILFIKDVLAQDFIVAPYKDDLPLINNSKPAQRSCASPDDYHQNSEFIFNSWDTLYIECLKQRFIVVRRYQNNTDKFDIYEHSLQNTGNFDENPDFSICKTVDSSVFNYMNGSDGLGLGFCKNSGQYLNAMHITNSKIDIGPAKPVEDKFCELYACRMLILYIIYRAYVLRLDKYLSKLAQLNTHSAYVNDKIYEEIISFKISKLYRNPLTAHK